MKDYKINIKVRNNRIIKAIENSGGTLGGKWCYENNLSYGSVNDLISLTSSPLQKNKIDLTTTATKLCEVLNKSPNELWSNEQINPLLTNNVSIELDPNELKQITQEKEIEPDKLLMNKQCNVAIEKLLKELTLREAEILRKHFYGNETLQEIAEYFDVTPERIRQIELRALEKLRRPKRAIELKDFVSEREAEKIEKNFYNLL
jgi:RNA polymerase sigma factor (sigma-70 family)